MFVLVSLGGLYFSGTTDLSGQFLVADVCGAKKYESVAEAIAAKNLHPLLRVFTVERTT